MKITIENHTLSTDEPISIAQLTNELLNAIGAGFNQVIAQAATQGEPESKVKEELYDIFNSAASEFLANLIPDKDMRPDVTAQALMEMENAILDREIVDMSDDLLNPTVVLEKDED
jgi:hypothetical protein